MDINDLRSFLTLASFLCFLAITAWAYSKGARKGFDEAAMLPFADGDERLHENEERKTFRGESS